MEMPGDIGKTQRTEGAMTEQEWLACTNQDQLLQYLSRKRRPELMRKLRLFSCACCRRIWHLFTDKRSRRAVEVAERFADGEVGLKELDKAAAQVRAVPAREPGPTTTATRRSRNR